MFEIDMTKSNALPIRCPYCPKTANYEFFTPEGVDAHFEIFDNHPSDPSKFKQKIRSAMDRNTVSEQPPQEKTIIEMWSEDNFHEFNYCNEVPVHVSELKSNNKRIDVVLFETWPFSNQSEYFQEAIQQGALNRVSGNFESKENQVRFILSNTSDPAKVSLFEAKRELDFSSIGQILAYSEFFTDYYSSCGEIQIVERGIIYGQGDEMCRKTAERYGISLYPVDWR